jgi:hypothetical protein
VNILDSISIKEYAKKILPINCINVTTINGKYTFEPILADIAANADNAAISIPIDKYNAQLTGFDSPYHIVTCDMDTTATVIIGIRNAAIIIAL